VTAGHRRLTRQGTKGSTVTATAVIMLVKPTKIAANSSRRQGKEQF
jgi:hypothetical protein